MNELSYLLTISKHPKTIQLLQHALDHEKRSFSVARKESDETSHQICVTGSNKVSVDTSAGHAVTGKIATKIKEYGELFGRCGSKWTIVRLLVLGFSRSVSVLNC